MEHLFSRKDDNALKKEKEHEFLEEDPFFDDFTLALDLIASISKVLYNISREMN